MKTHTCVVNCDQECTVAGNVSQGVRVGGWHHLFVFGKSKNDVTGIWDCCINILAKGTTTGPHL